MDYRKKGIDAYRAAKGTSVKKEEPSPALKEKREEGKAPQVKPQKNNSNSNGSKPDDSQREPLKGLLKAQKGGGIRKAAKLLLLLGKDQAVEIVKHLSQEELEELSREIARIRQIEKIEAVKLLEEFGDLVKSVREPRGGVEAARNLLVAAFGEEKGGILLNRAVPMEGRKPFAFLDDLEDEQILILLKNESVPVVSLILGYLDRKKASAIIQKYPPALQKELILRLGRMKKVDPVILENIEAVLKDRIRTQGRVVTEEIDGTSVLAEILKYSDLSLEERILEGLSTENEDLSRQVKERIFTLDIIFQIKDTDLQGILRDYEDAELAILLKGKSDSLRERILLNVSERRRTLITEEYIRLGAMKKKDVDKATKDFLNYLRRLEVEKKLVIPRENEYFV